MRVSLIIPTYQAGRYLPALLEKLQSQSLQFECIIIDSSSTDDTLNLIKSYADKIITIKQSDFDHGGTRTQAAKVASGEIIIFLTQDALPVDSHSLETLIKVFENTEIGVAYGRQLPYPHTNLFGKHLRVFNYPYQSYIRSLEDKSIYGMKTAFLSDSFSAT